MRTKSKIEFGDFQTPFDLAREIVQLLKSIQISPNIVVEPTCGLGSFLKASIAIFGSDVKYYGFDINPDYVKKAKNSIATANGIECEIRCQNFFEQDWKAFFTTLSDNILVIGNPPWVTNSALGSLRGENLPGKSNFQQHRGFAAKTGKANFDISEWILIKLMESLNHKKACIAMLCKTATARKVLRHSWRNDFNITDSSLHLIDANKHFGVSVDACLFITHTGKKPSSRTATIFAKIDFKEKLSRFGIVKGELVADVDVYENLKDIDGIEYCKWRSGVKHDAAKVMEFTADGDIYVNGFGERCNLEDTYMYPLLKSSDLANGRLLPHRFVLLTQRRISADTSVIKENAPKTWQYLLDHAEFLDQRRSIIYKKRPRFSIFGVGDYTFAPCKVAISGLYRNLSFAVVGSLHGKPIVVDDTCYFIPCKNREEANFFATLLNSEVTERFIRALVFFDAKRPINIDLLRRIDLKKVAEKMNLEEQARLYLKNADYENGKQQLFVFEEEEEYKANQGGQICPT
ncbi:SAM-dependent DNA methyltransferase [Candidatus Poribacteria bacterium]|nr:SAM-dependent DNA methyltransferase [Candidatus Poribacteria bacterium]